MKINRESLLTELNSNVCEIRFLRRLPKPNAPSTRRMLCCNNINFLTSVEGRITLNFKQSNSSPRYNTADENTIITWDIFMQQWRTINCDSVELINKWNTNQFWNIFNESFANWSPDQKILFMNT